MITENQEQYQRVLNTAQQLAERAPEWVTFFREVLGVEGVVRKAFPNFDDLVEFEKSEEYASIQRLLVKLREKKVAADTESEPTRVITVRLPKSMHEYLRTEAHDLRTSMNKLCISKLCQMVEQEMIPAEKTSPKRRSSSAPTPAPAASTTLPFRQTAPVPSSDSLANRYAASPNGASPLKTSF